ncbi:MAG: helix-turn-helix transcriptional regulator [Clostridiales bacterium]|nr:helix-turn-helix transcriptional regulator [Clostridiales bacterium]
MSTIGERIQELLKESDYTQKELANMVGVTESAMSRYINDDRVPKSKIVANLATALNTTSEYIISGKAPENDFAEIYRLVARSTSNMTTEEKFELMRLLTKE